MRKKVAVEMRYQAFNRKHSTSAIDFSIEFKRACDLSRVLEGAPVTFSIEFMNGSDLVAIKTRLILSSNDAISHERSITTYPEVVNHLLRRYPTEIVTVTQIKRYVISNKAR